MSKLYCIEISRGGVGEEDMVAHAILKDPDREEVLEYIVALDVGYDDNYCKFDYYPVG
tara:strand:+ start:2017 stop:2190 length:174 start_codon:yes stop_codon:yes gene_type:complete